MKLKKEVLLLVFIILLITIVSANEGCCQEKTTGVYCQDGIEEGSCSSASEGGWSASACNETTFCAMGCCVNDGVCAQNTGQYTCTMGGGDWDPESTCSIEQCEKVCCNFGSEYSFTTINNCIYKYEDYVEEPTWDETITTEEECNIYNYADEVGCCVTGTRCAYESGEECFLELATEETNIEAGYGFHQGKTCAEIQEELEEEDYEASCNCEPSGTKCTSDQKIYETNTCGDEVIIDECTYPNDICYYPESDRADCRSANCDSTFKFEVDSTINQDLQNSANLNNFNEYTVYNDYKEKFETFELGGERQNHDSWCVFEGPTGSFRDRVGTQHYIATCNAGEEIWYSCGESREEYCAMHFDTNNRPQAECITNNFEEYYTYPYNTGKWSSDGTTPNDPNVEGSDTGYTNRIYEFAEYIDEPIISIDNDDNLGVSTVPIAKTDYCNLGSFTCDLVYGEVGTGQLYINSICLRSEFATMAADYCGSRGDCGLNLNVLGMEGGQESFYREGFNPTDAESIVGIEYGLGDCFDSSGGGQDPNHLIAELLQGKMGYSGRTDGCDVVDANDISPFYYSFLKGNENTIYTIEPFLLSDHMIPYLFPLRRMMYYSGMCADNGEISYENLNSILKGLGTNYDFSTLDFCKKFTEEYENGEYVESDEITLVEGNSDSIYPHFYELTWNSIYQTSYDENKPKVGGALYSLDGESMIKSEEELDECGDDSAIALTSYCSEDKFSISKQYKLYNELKSIKPWVLYTPQLRADSYSNEYNKAGRGITWYDGWFGYSTNDGESFTCVSEWCKASDNDGATGRSTTYMCEAWTSPSGGDYCELCDTSSIEGGTIFTNKEGSKFDVSQCNQPRCESLGECTFVKENLGTDRPSCIPEPCDYGDYPVLTRYDEPLEESTDESPLIIDIENNPPGYDATNLPPGFKISFGVETDLIGRCRFIEDWKYQEILDDNEVDTVQQLRDKFPDPDHFYPLFLGTGITPTPPSGTESCDDEDCFEAAGRYHNVTEILNNGEEKSYYVICENMCGEFTPDFYKINLKASDIDPTTYGGSEANFDPASNTYYSALEDTAFVYLYTDIPATCKYTQTQGDNYELFEYEMETCQQESSEIILGDYYCNTELPISDGTNTFYFLCQDNYRNDMSSSKEWVGIKADPLLISQSGPEGTQVYSDITLDVRTQAGAEAGKSACYYKQSHQYNYDQMTVSQDGDSWWTQTQTLGEGDYNYDIYCEDIAGNINETTISFTMDIDEYPPEITRIYYLSGTIYTTTNEDTTCEYDSTSFVYGSGFSMTGIETTEHSVTKTEGIENYYIICQDIFGNQNTPFVVNLDYLEE